MKMYLIHMTLHTSTFNDISEDLINLIRVLSQVDRLTALNFIPLTIPSSTRTPSFLVRSRSLISPPFPLQFSLQLLYRHLHVSWACDIELA
jgi:hypothetical protein